MADNSAHDVGGHLRLHSYCTAGWPSAQVIFDPLFFLALDFLHSLQESRPLNSS